MWLLVEPPCGRIVNFSYKVAIKAPLRRFIELLLAILKLPDDDLDGVLPDQVGGELAGEGPVGVHLDLGRAAVTIRTCWEKMQKV